MVVIPPGSFYLRSVAIGDKVPPPTLITISHPLAVGIYDVTRSQYSQFVKETGYTGSGGCQVNEHGNWWVPENDRSWRNPGFAQSPRDPVTCVSWNDAHAYISWLNRKAGFVDNGQRGKGPHYRLPSGEEWEYAATGGNILRGVIPGLGPSYYWGMYPSHEFANYGLDTCGWNCGGKREAADRWLYTSPVGSFAPNSFGIYDGFGNVWQITDDCTHSDEKGVPLDGAAWEVGGDCRYRAARGGSYDDGGLWYGADTFLTSTRNNANGFRVVRTLE